MFNTAQFMVATGLGGLVYYAFAPQQAPAALDLVQNVWALPLAGLTMYLANTLAVAGIVGLQRGQGLAEIWLAGRRQTLLQFAGLLLIGLLAAREATHEPWTLPILLLPVGLAYLALQRTAQLIAQTNLLRQSEEHFRTLVEMAPDVIFSVDAESGAFAARARLSSASPAGR